MTQEDKQLLIKDISSRLPYGVKVEDRNGTHVLSIGNTEFTDLFGGKCNIKPYLRPMSSMTEEEKEDLLITLLGKKDAKYFQVLPDGSIDNTDAAHQDLSNFNIHWINFDGVNTSTYIDWLNKNMFDYRNLIGKKLALDCTGLHIYD